MSELRYSIDLRTITDAISEATPVTASLYTVPVVMASFYVVKVSKNFPDLKILIQPISYFF
jgi:hypothetical protein